MLETVWPFVIASLLFIASRLRFIWLANSDEEIIVVTDIYWPQYFDNKQPSAPICLTVCLMTELSVDHKDLSGLPKTRQEVTRSDKKWHEASKEYYKHKHYNAFLCMLHIKNLS